MIVYKGPDTLVAAPDGRLGFAPPAPAWLATAGTGDVLAGMIAAIRARGLEPFEAACAAVWLHGRAAEVAGPGMIADDLVAAIPSVLMSEPIVRIAARGDGVTAGGRHIAFRGARRHAARRRHAGARARAIRRRHAAISRNAAAASCSI